MRTAPARRISGCSLPRILGVLSMLGELGWLTFLYPPLGYGLFLYVAVFAPLGSAAMIFWLIVFGVNEEQWWERAAQPAAEAP